MTDSDLAALEAKKTKRIRFDGTINLGHIITFLGFMLAGFGAWSTLDKRVVVLEESRKAQEMTDRHQDQAVGQNMQHIRETLTEIKRNVERMNDKLERRS